MKKNRVRELIFTLFKAEQGYKSHLVHSQDLPTHLKELIRLGVVRMEFQSGGTLLIPRPFWMDGILKHYSELPVDIQTRQELRDVIGSPSLKCLPLVIETEKANDELLELIEELMSLDSLTVEQRDLLVRLATLVEDFEERHYTIAH